jgi:ketosteroid isomerase-like protein
MTNAKEAATAVWRAFASRDPDAIRAVLTEDVRWMAPPRNATQVALGAAVDMLETREGIITFITKYFRRLFPDGAEFIPIKIVAEDDTVVFEQRMRATLIDGRMYDNVYCWLFEMEGERVREIREYMDTLAGQRMIFGDAPPRQIA